MSAVTRAAMLGRTVRDLPPEIPVKKHLGNGWQLGVHEH